MKWTPCECDEPGWCHRHKCLKPGFLVDQCQVSKIAFDRWERGQGPCVPTVEVPPEGPGLARRAVNFGTAVVRHAANGLQQVNTAAFEARIRICQNCSSCDSDRMVCLQPSCGCSLTIKARWASEDCPLGLWPNLRVSDDGSTSGLHPPEPYIAS